MDNLKRFIVIPICLLTACAQLKPSLESQGSRITQGAHLSNKSAHLNNKATPLDNSSAALPLNNKTAPLGQYKGRSQGISSWEVRGAMAAKNKSKGWNAVMTWRQNGPSSYHIRLMGPLGAGTILIDKQGGLITFQDGPKKIHSNNADTLLLQQTGIRLPVSNLYYWMRGLPAPGPVAGERRDATNHLIQLRQSGYSITFGNYTSVQGADLPGTIRLDGNGVMVKVVIKQWNI
jgi:outer membrane lipoprotein LolB